jgi:hypothetical protein
MVWRKQTKDEHRLTIMCGAQTRATTKLTVSGQPRGMGYRGDPLVKPVTLPKMPWEEESETRRAWRGGDED